MAETGDVVLQNLLPQTARAAVYQQLQAVWPKIGWQQIAAVHGIRRLQFGKVVATADSAKRTGAVA